ncbi:MAG TPA: GNAT family N-acetyltransferase [Gemmatimonadales bacterium]|nr:GNAT family N-acetyltransferase [Gemmatimonadales bacterium]
MTFTKYLTDLRTLPGDVVRAWRAGGWVAVQDEIRKRTLDRVGGYVRRFVVEADLSRLAEVSPPEGVEIRLFSGPDWSLLGDMGRRRLTPQFGAAMEAGRICLVAWKRRRAVGYVWFSSVVESRIESYDLPLPPDTVYIWQVEVSRSERRHGVAAALLSSGLQLARDRGLRRSWIIIHPDDVACLRTIASVAPSQVLGTVARLKVLSRIHSRYRALSVPVQIEGTLVR